MRDSGLGVQRRCPCYNNLSLLLSEVFLCEPSVAYISSLIWLTGSLPSDADRAVVLKLEDEISFFNQRKKLFSFNVCLENATYFQYAATVNKFRIIIPMTLRNL